MAIHSRRGDYLTQYEQAQCPSGTAELINTLDEIKQCLENRNNLLDKQNELLERIALTLEESNS